MPEAEYEKKLDSVLAWKKAQKLGRFDPNAPSHAAARKSALEAEAQEKGIKVGKRCRVGADDGRRGLVMYAGEVPEIPGDGLWVGIRLDEPLGKNDGTIGGTRYWEPQGEAPAMKHGVFVRPERVDIGDWLPFDDLEDMEEI
ncbi:CAP-Gly domain containing protein [Zalerion maritima]|uniref:CAP-Gly domain containing protein n=1 Tax=Zalerion maritima TaxID=339359 RepID=A0AAD5RXK4_9PEZI|nr:CAP-Gly domain containing protein [Zalerion maritima]